MPKKRVHEIAKQQGLTSKEVLAALKAAGIEAKVAQSSVEEAEALKALQAAGADGAGADARSAAPAPKAQGAKRASPRRRAPMRLPRRLRRLALRPGAEPATPHRAAGPPVASAAGW